MKQFLAFEGVQEARKFAFDCIDERLNNLNFSEGAFNKQFESLCKQVVALQEAIKAIKDTQNEQSREITSLQKRIWALEPSEDDKKREQKRGAVVELFKSRVKGELKSELLEFIKGELAEKLEDKIISRVSAVVADALNERLKELNNWVSGLQLVQKGEFETLKKDMHDEVISLRQRVKSLEVSSSGEAMDDIHTKFNGMYNFVKNGLPAEALYYVSNYAKHKGLTLANIQKKEVDMHNATGAFFKGFYGMYNTYKNANITLDVARKLWCARCYTQECINIKSAEADLQWFDDAIKKYGTYSGEFFKAILEKHRIDGGVLKRTLFLPNFQPKGA